MYEFEFGFMCKKVYKCRLFTCSPVGAVVPIWAEVAELILLKAFVVWFLGSINVYKYGLRACRRYVTDNVCSKTVSLKSKQKVVNPNVGEEGHPITV